MFGFFDANSSVNSEVRQRTPLITYAQIVERTTAWVLQHIGTRKFLWFVLLFFFVTHLYRINDPPVGFHKWRETDTVAVAYNFYTENWNFFKPRIDLRGAGDGIVGMELPIYSYATALLFALFGYSHIWPRLLTVLGTCLFLLGLHRLSKALTGSVAFAGLTTFLASVSPLVVFYGRKIQPDIWALALAVNGLAFFVSWVVKNQAWHGVFSAVCVALGAAVKPTMLCIGLPMLGLLIARHRFAFLWGLRYWLFGMVCLLPAFLWFHYALYVNPATQGYIYLGGNWGEILAALQGYRFYQHVFFTFGELIIGLPVVWAFFWGLWKIRSCAQFSFILLYIAGCYLVFAGTASHVATAHDYYTLPAVAPLAFVTAHGVILALTHYRWVLNLLALFSLVVMPMYSWGRIAERYDKPYDFFAGRTLANTYIPQETKVIVYDWTPGVLLYRTGRKGWRIDRSADLSIFLEAIRGGAQFFVVEDDYSDDLTPFKSYIGPPVYRHEGITVYPIVATAPTDAPLPRPQWASR
jgi:Dolichyl-phosphate-mannose-protein mannosyltransferase